MHPSPTSKNTQHIVAVAFFMEGSAMLPPPKVAF